MAHSTLSHEHFKASPIYQTALRAGHVMHQQIPGRGTALWPHDNVKIELCCKKLDHLINRAFKLKGGYLHVCIISAMKAFLRHLDSTLHTLRVPHQLHSEITTRMEFCRQIVAASDQEIMADGGTPQRTEWFEEYIISFDSDMTEIVYGSPFSSMFAGPGRFSGIGSIGNRLDNYHTFMMMFWD